MAKKGPDYTNGRGGMGVKRRSLKLFYAREEGQTKINE